MLWVYPSIAVDFAKYCTQHKLTFKNLKGIQVNSEQSTRAIRDKLSQQFSCPVLDQYGAEEVGQIATECEYGVYHIEDDMVHVEVVDEEGNSVKPGTVGNILVTGMEFNSYFIRYALGDKGCLSFNRSCKCGRNTSQLEMIEGRKKDEMFICDKSIPSAILLDTIYTILLNNPSSIDCCRMNQLSPTSIELEIHKCANDMDEQGIYNTLYSVFPETCSMKIKYLSKPFYQTTCGKRKMINVLPQK